MAVGQGGRHESFKWGRAALTATNDEIVTLVTLGWDIGRVVESGDPLDEAMAQYAMSADSPRPTVVATWQIYSRRFSMPIHFRQCGHRFDGS